MLDYQGGDANNPEAKFDPGEEFVSVTELPDGVQGNYLSGRPRGRLEVTEQIDLWHPVARGGRRPGGLHLPPTGRPQHPTD